jgi:hypothetical protein
LVCEHSEAPRRLKGAGRHVFQKIGDVLHTPATELPTIGLSIPHRHPSRLLKQVFSPLPAGFFLVRPAGRTHLEVKVLYWPGKGNS